MSRRIEDIRVALVSPPQGFLSNPIMAEPLGLMYIEGVLERLGVSVEMVDMSVDSRLPEADIYGFSASTIHFSQAVKYAKLAGGAYTMIGGPHASSLPEEAKKFFDAVVVGPGENAVAKILAGYLKNKGGIYKEPASDINSIPIPPRTILKRMTYRVSHDLSKSASIISSRGCPYECAFCSSNTVWGRQVSYRSVENVVEEIRYLMDRFGIKSFKFVDDVFTLDKDRFRLFLKAFAPLGIRWQCETRVDAVSDEILDQMATSGCTYIDLGIESVSDIVLDKIRKGQDLAKMENAIERIRSKGLKVKVYIIYCLPFEPEDIVQRTIDFINRARPDHVSLFTFVPYPGSDIWNNPVRYNVKRIITDFDLYQHSVGGLEKELSWLPTVEYFDRSRERMRDERNILKKFSIEWNRRQWTSQAGSRQEMALLQE